MTIERTVDADLLRTFSPLDSLKADNLKAVAGHASLLGFGTSEVLFRQGEPNGTTYYLVSGAVELRHDGKVVATIRSGTAEARYPLEAGPVHRHAARIVSGHATILTVDTARLDVLLTWDQTGTYHVDELRPAGCTPEEGEADWMIRLLQSKAFERIPPANIQTMFMRLQRVDYRAGDAIIRQGSDGDYFYVVIAGHCAVTRDMPLQGGRTLLAQLGPGDTFGEEALIAGGRRNASVEMLTDGAVMRLRKEDFQSLCNEPMLSWVFYGDAERIVAGGGKWLDVRLPSEVQNFGIPGAVNVPLYHLRSRLAGLGTGPYVVCCDTGRRSSVAAYILGQHGIDAHVLKGGLTGTGSVAGIGVKAALETDTIRRRASALL